MYMYPDFFPNVFKLPVTLNNLKQKHVHCV